MKYAELLMEWLVEFGYTQCFFVAGGNNMHLLDAARSRMRCIPFVHEVAAGIAAEAFNEAPPRKGERAFALVTAGPGLTNIVTAIGGAWLESRDVLVIGGQVKTEDLARGTVRQRGIQEVDGTAIVRPICKLSVRIDTPVSHSQVAAWTDLARTPRKGPIFIEIPLDVQGMPVDAKQLSDRVECPGGGLMHSLRTHAIEITGDVAEKIRVAKRPVILIGGGVDREVAWLLGDILQKKSVALMTTWNGTDRIDACWKNYFGRPNTWGMRYSNVLLQQADLVVAVGTRLGLQQTGFNWREFTPLALVIQADVDESELNKGHPRVDEPLHIDANALLENLAATDLGEHAEWLTFCRKVKATLPLQDPQNITRRGYIDPFLVAQQLSVICAENDVIIPCSSGGTYTTMMQAFEQRLGQIFISDKGSAAMGYGLSLAIGAALAHPERRVLLTEGDGGFAQNLQELATVEVNRLNLKIFLYSNEGYASIRMTQLNYFKGEYLGCDVKTGLGFPDWLKLFDAYGIPATVLDERGLENAEAVEHFRALGPHAFIVPVDPEQTYFPKISSRVTSMGSMESAPLHEMTPELSPEVRATVLPYLARTNGS